MYMILRYVRLIHNLSTAFIVLFSILCVKFTMFVFNVSVHARLS